VGEGCLMDGLCAEWSGLGGLLEVLVAVMYLCAICQFEMLITTGHY
jgi:hypothetical protein